jgi:hypothetical protein
MHTLAFGQFEHPIPCGSITINTEVWAVYLLAATRGHGEWILTLRMVAESVHELNVRVEADPSHSVTARRVIEAVRHWLAQSPPGVLTGADAERSARLTAAGYRSGRH